MIDFTPRQLDWLQEHARGYAYALARANTLWFDWVVTTLHYVRLFGDADIHAVYAAWQAWEDDER
jgi:hypothetical protein